MPDAKDLKDFPMQVSIETTEGLGRRMTVQVPAERVEQEIERRLKDMAGRMKMDGFRPGKVPVKMVRKQYGEHVRQEVVNELLRQTYSDALKEQDLRPAGAPQVTPKQDESGQDLIYEASFEVLPQIEITGIEQIKVERPQVEVTDADVDNVLDRLRQQHADYEEVDRPAAQGDRVEIDFHGTVDGEEFQGNKAEDAAIIIGAGQLPEDFEQALVGAAAGTELTVEHTFPQGGDSPVAGKTAAFQVSVKRVEQANLPELDDAFAARLGVESGLNDLRDAVRANLENERDQAVRQRVKRQVMDQLAELNPVELPKSLIDGEIQALREQSGGASEGDMPETERDAYEEIARRRVQLGLLVNELVRSQQIQLDKERMMRELRQMAAQSGQDPNEALQQYAQNRRMMESLEASIIEEQAVDWLLEQVQTEERGMSFDELLNRDGNVS
ncbi:trigger factor [Halorhodospira halochloris]|uniref:trigger factor n=1 Tax=Halorhodospira halochloris TaxID=1052 RepID=UPI001EE8991C|nr:trigger factor [Halorhodospira halochloris]MCG5531415.1 trigger factor [Halorhodospira halochloris]